MNNQNIEFSPSEGAMFFAILAKEYNTAGKEEKARAFLAEAVKFAAKKPSRPKQHKFVCDAEKELNLPNSSFEKRGYYVCFVSNGVAVYSHIVKLPANAKNGEVCHSKEYSIMCHVLDSDEKVGLALRGIINYMDCTEKFEGFVKMKNSVQISRLKQQEEK